MGERDNSEVIDDSAEMENGQPVSQKRLESLLFDDPSTTPMANGVVVQSSYDSSGREKHHLGLLITLLFLLALTFAAGYIYLSRIAPQQLPAVQVDHYVSPKISIPSRPQVDLPGATSGEVSQAPPANIEAEPLETQPTPATAVPLFTVVVGPFINSTDLREAVGVLKELGLQPQKIAGRGTVTMIRLLEGVYPEKEARIRLAELQALDRTAFLLPLGDNFAVYAGSFHHESGAQELKNELAAQSVRVTFVESEVTMNGTSLTVLQADQQTANELAVHLSSLGLNTQLLKKK